MRETKVPYKAEIPAKSPKHVGRRPTGVASRLNEVGNETWMTHSANRTTQLEQEIKENTRPESKRRYARTSEWADDGQKYKQQYDTNMNKHDIMKYPRKGTVIQGTGWQEVQEQEPPSKADGRRFNSSSQNTTHGHRDSTRNRMRESNRFEHLPTAPDWADTSADAGQRRGRDESRRTLPPAGPNLRSRSSTRTANTGEREVLARRRKRHWMAQEAKAIRRCPAVARTPDVATWQGGDHIVAAVVDTESKDKRGSRLSRVSRSVSRWGNKVLNTMKAPFQRGAKRRNAVHDASETVILSAKAQTPEAVMNVNNEPVTRPEKSMVRQAPQEKEKPRPEKRVLRPNMSAPTKMSTRQIKGNIRNDGGGRCEKCDCNITNHASRCLQCTVSITAGGGQCGTDGADKSLGGEQDARLVVMGGMSTSEDKVGSKRRRLKRPMAVPVLPGIREEPDSKRHRKVDRGGQANLEALRKAALAGFHRNELPERKTYPQQENCQSYDLCSALHDVRLWAVASKKGALESGKKNEMLIWRKSMTPLTRPNAADLDNATLLLSTAKLLANAAEDRVTPMDSAVLRCTASCFARAALSTAQRPMAMEGLINGIIRHKGARKIRRYFQHKLDEILREGGLLTHLNLVKELQKPRSGVMALDEGLELLLKYWQDKTTLAEARLPLSKEEWTDVLECPNISVKDMDSYTSESGVVRWDNIGDSEMQNERSIISGTAVSWNANGLRRRLQDGSLSALIAKYSPVHIHITEVKSNVMRLGRPWELRLALSHLGYKWCTFNWATAKNKTTGISCNGGDWGSAMFSKVRPVSESCGFDNDDKDEEGRTIIQRFENMTIIGVYQPCTAMDDESIGERRQAYDEKLQILVKKEQQRTVPLFIYGDFNVAPGPQDSTISPRLANCTPGTKQEEIRNHALLKTSCTLMDAHAILANSAELPMTWSGGGPRGAWSARLDICLAAMDHIGESRQGASITALIVADSKFNSDHTPIVMNFEEPTIMEQQKAYEDPAYCEPRIFNSQDIPSDPAAAFDVAFADLPEVDDAAWKTAAEIIGKVAEDDIEPKSPRLEELDMHPKCMKEECEERQCESVETENNNIIASLAQPDEEEELEESQPETIVREAVLPTLALNYKTSKGIVNLTTLVDSGAVPNAMSLDTARMLGLAIKQPEGRDRYIKLADQSVSATAGITKVCLKLDGFTTIHVPFLVLQDCPYQALIGSSTLKHYKGSIDYEEGIVAMTVRQKKPDRTVERRIEMPIMGYYEGVTASKAGCMVAEQDQTLKPNSQMLIPVVPDDGVERNSWGLMKDGPRGLWKTKNGITFYSGSGHHGAILMNPTPETIIIRAGTPVASFHTVDPSLYNCINFASSPDEAWHGQHPVPEHGKDITYPIPLIMSLWKTRKQLT